jgi:mgtE-like transporter
MRETIKVFVEILSSVTLSIPPMVFVGLLLGGTIKYILSFPGLIVLIPPLLNMRGCISSALAARLTTSIHLGLVREIGDEESKQNLYASLLLTMVTSVLIGVFADLTCRSLGFPSLGVVNLTLLAVIAGGLAVSITIFTTFFVAFYAAKKGVDPDNVTVPIVTTVGDVLTLSSILIATVMLARLGFLAGV